LDDPARRAELADAGYTRSLAFTWDACAQKHVEVYQRAAAAAS